MDLAAITSALSGLKVATDLAKGVQSLKTDTEVRQKTSDLLDAVLSARATLFEAQETQTTLLQRIKELEQKVASFEDWDREKQRYQLKAIDTGAFAYMHKPGMENGEPAVWLCQACFQKGHVSPLQFRAQDRGTGGAGGRGTHSRWGCNLCKAEIVVAYVRQPHVPWEPSTAERPQPPTSGFGTARIIRG
jgi:BMFP domain-containing protein YqiC